MRTKKIVGILENQKIRLIDKKINQYWFRGKAAHYCVLFYPSGNICLEILEDGKLINKYFSTQNETIFEILKTEKIKIA